MAVALLAGCAPLPEPVGLNYGPRYAWVKDGASDLETRRQMFDCAQRDSGALETGTQMSMVPFVGLAVVLAGAPQMVSEEAGRHLCMRTAGFRLVDLRTGREMRSDGWGLRPVDD